MSIDKPDIANLEDLHDAREALMLAEQALTRVVAGIAGQSKREEFVFQIGRAQGLLMNIAIRIKGGNP
jgi:hypothetical protein